MRETQILQLVRIKASKLGYKLSRNNSGSFEDKNGRWVKFGLFSPGGSDLIGWRTIKITQEMVGKKIAQFVAIEVKTTDGKLDKEQEHFLDVVRDAGGDAILARSEDDVSF